MRCRKRGGLVLGAIVVAGCLLAPGVASASSVAVVGKTGEKRIAYLADAGEANRLTVTRTGSTGPEGSATNTYTVTDGGATVRVGAGCVRVTPRAARCSIAEPEGLDVSLGDRGDTATVRVDGLRDVAVDGEAGNDALSVTASRADLDGGGGSDQLSTPGDGFNVLDGGGGGRDVLRGGDGSDTLSDGDSSTAPDADVLDGGDNLDIESNGFTSGDSVSYADRTRKVTVDLAADRGGQAGEGDRLSNIEDADGGRAGDTLKGDGSLNVLTDGGENPYATGGDPEKRPADKDRLLGRGGDDFLVSTSGRDRLYAGSGDDSLDCYSRRRAFCRLFGGRGTDDLSGGHGNDRLSGGPGADTLAGDSGRDRLTGGTGRDELSGGRGRDTLYSRDRSRDRVNGGSGRDRAKADKRDRVKSVEKLRRR